MSQTQNRAMAAYQAANVPHDTASVQRQLATGAKLAAAPAEVKLGVFDEASEIISRILVTANQSKSALASVRGNLWGEGETSSNSTEKDTEPACQVARLMGLLSALESAVINIEYQASTIRDRL